MKCRPDDGPGAAKNGVGDGTRRPVSLSGDEPFWRAVPTADLSLERRLPLEDTLTINPRLGVATYLIEDSVGNAGILGSGMADISVLCGD